MPLSLSLSLSVFCVLTGNAMGGGLPPFMAPKAGGHPSTKTMMEPQNAELKNSMCDKSSMMSMWLIKHTVQLRCDSTMSRRVDSDCHNNSLRVEPVLTDTKPPAKSNKPRGLAIDFYQTTATGFSRPRLSLSLSLLLALASRSQPPHPPPIPPSLSSSSGRSPPLACCGGIGRSEFSTDLLAWEPHILISSVVEWASQVFARDKKDLNW
nr:PREDICTED: uncharacterized protein LOC108952938 isoform X2 [Musa acuminata subsp. malaccensis]